MRTCPHPDCGKRNFADAPLCSHCSRPMSAMAAPFRPAPAAPPPVRSPVPYRASPSATPPTAIWPPPAATSPTGAGHPLPKALSRLGPPQLEGEIEDVREQQVTVPQNSVEAFLKTLVSLILLPLKPFLVIGAWLFRGPTPKEKRTAYVLGVRKDDGIEEQARIEEELVGALPRLGDYVSLWGVPRYGVWIVSRGYNHSVTAEIRVRGR